MKIFYSADIDERSSLIQQTVNDIDEKFWLNVAEISPGDENFDVTANW